MKTVFIAHQIAGNLKENIKSALHWARWALKERQVVPVIPYVYFCLMLDDADEGERELGTKCSMEILRRCEELWICGPLPSKTSEVWKEVAEAERMNKRIIDYSNLTLPKKYADFSPAE